MDSANGRPDTPRPAWLPESEIIVSHEDTDEISEESSYYSHRGDELNEELLE